MNIEQYLHQHHTKSTIYGYNNQIKIYLKEQSFAKNANYKEIVEYIGKLRNRYHNPATIKYRLKAIKKYYDYLLATGQRKDHPCKDLYLKDKHHKDVQLYDLLTEKELENLFNYQSKRFKNTLEIRNKTILSLLVYQALTKKELLKLTLADINLESGTIYIKSSKTSNSRTLELKNNQIMLLHKYITEIRPKLLQIQVPSPQERAEGEVFITVKGFPEKGDSIKHIFNNIYKQTGKNITIQKIRQSVIAIKLKQGTDIRKVQHFAGHKNASSTERYKGTDIEELKVGINKYHPLK